MATTFLQAEWRKLLMLNYAVNADLLTSYLPAKTELDYWNDTCYISLVGFMFLNTRLRAIPIPFHRNFEEINLRFYVRYKNKDEWKRGVVFIKEIVPKPALTFVAQKFYKENYVTMSMKHKWVDEGDTLSVEYAWKYKEWNSISAVANNSLEMINTGSEEEFITEHYWGYTKIDNSTTNEYKVEHPTWQVYKVNTYNISVDFGKVYDDRFKHLNTLTPRSVFLAEGSSIKVNNKSSL
jgi:uncharacterized protein YqjF (DUF2071 family)